MAYASFWSATTNNGARSRSAYARHGKQAPRPAKYVHIVGQEIGDENGQVQGGRNEKQTEICFDRMEWGGGGDTGVWWCTEPLSVVNCGVRTTPTVASVES